MKSYTDLEQSKVLVEFLSLESADMYWRNGSSNEYIQCFTPFTGTALADYDYDVPCWSLAALLEIIPERICDKDGFSYDIEITKQNGLCYINYEPTGIGYQAVGSGPADTMVDACVEVINKLHDLKKL